MKKRLGNFALVAMAFAMTLFLFTSGTAMDIYSSQTLPAPTNGGVATYVYRFNDVYVVTGFVKPTANTTQAARWEGPELDAFVLPGLGGPNSLGDTGTHEVGYWAAHVGSAQNPGEVWKPVLWVDGPGDTITINQLPTLGGPQGNAHSIGSLNGNYYIGGSTQTGTGNWVATFWKWSNGFPTMIRNLGTLGGDNSEVSSLTDNEYLDFGIEFHGRAQDAGGQWHACKWKSTDGGDTWSIIDLSNGFVSAITDFAGGNNTTYGIVSGWATFPSGFRRGFMDYTDDSLFVFPPTPGFNNSSIDTGAGAPFGSRGAGEVWNNPNNRTSAIFNSIRSINQHRSYPIGAVQEQGMDLDTTFVPLNLSESQAQLDWILAGKSLVTEISFPSLMTPTGDEVPDVVTILPTVRGGPVQRVNEFWTWHEDFFRAKVKRDTRSTNPATVQFSFYNPKELGIEGICSITLRTVGTGTPTSRTASATLRAVLPGGGFLDLGKRAINGFAQTVDFVRWAETSCLLPFSELRLQLVFTLPESHVTGYEIDKVRLHNM